MGLRAGRRVRPAHGQLAIHRDFVKLVYGNKVNEDDAQAVINGWVLRLKVGWEVFCGEYSRARAILNEYADAFQAV